MLDDGLQWICALSAVRGAGFAVLTVLGATLAAQVAPLARRGESIGIYGLAIAVPNLIAVPAGVALVLDGHIGWLAWLAASPVLGVFLVPRLVRVDGAAAGAGPGGPRRAAVLAALAPSLVLFVVTLAGGGLVTFLPIERPDGVAGDRGAAAVRHHRRRHPLARRLLADRSAAGCCCRSSLVVAAVGMVLMAVGLWAGDGVGADRCGGVRCRLRRDAEPDPAVRVRPRRRGRDDDGQRDVEHLVRRRHRGRCARARVPRRGDRAGLDLRASSPALLAAAVPLASAASRVAVRS